MAQYTVKYGQNIYDIAVQLYGSIEGLFDLLITNPELEMDQDLVPGQVLEYHDYFIVNTTIKSSVDNQETLIANGESKVYYQDDGSPFMILDKNKNMLLVTLSLSGSGAVTIDWGDNTPRQTIVLSQAIVNIEHFYQIGTASKIMFFGSPVFDLFAIKHNTGELYPLKNLNIKEYGSINSTSMLPEIDLFLPLSAINLSNSWVPGLEPIYDKLNLRKIDLTGIKCESENWLGDWLQYIIANYQGRKSATVYLSGEISKSDLYAMRQIMNEPEWNTDGNWEFFINGVTALGFILGKGQLTKNIL